jgi:hypothetical protein
VGDGDGASAPPFARNMEHATTNQRTTCNTRGANIVASHNPQSSTQPSTMRACKLSSSVSVQMWQGCDQAPPTPSVPHRSAMPNRGPRAARHAPVQAAFHGRDGEYVAVGKVPPATAAALNPHRATPVLPDGPTHTYRHGAQASTRIRTPTHTRHDRDRAQPQRASVWRARFSAGGRRHCGRRGCLSVRADLRGARAAAEDV